MTNQKIDPFTLRPADIVLAAVNSPALAPAQTGLGLGDIEKVFEFLDKFLPRMEAFKNQIQGLRDMESGNKAAENGDDRSEGVPNMITQLPAKEINPIDVYSKMLGALSKLATERPEITMPEAFEQAKKYKDFIMPEIVSMLKELSA